jgi:hypothetical protein
MVAGEPEGRWPRDMEIVYFTDFHRLGLSLPLHRFAHGLLFFYGLCLHNLTLEGILHIATSITLCEAFLGSSPTSQCGGGCSRRFHSSLVAPF